MTTSDNIPPLSTVATLWDGWTEQSFGVGRSDDGAVDAWTYLTNRYGSDGLALDKLQGMLRPIMEFAVTLYNLDPHVRFASDGQEWGPAQWPLNLLIYLNDVRRWTPEQFRDLHLRYQFSIEDARGIR
jgi:hypothetical protein